MGALITYPDTLPRFFDSRKISWDKILQAFNSGAGGGGGCSTADTVLAHDEMLFSWESGDSAAPWSGPAGSTDADAATIDQAFDTSALSTGKPAGACDVGFRTTLTGNAGYDCLQFDRGSAIAAATNLDVKFHFLVQTTLSGVARTSIAVGGALSNPTGLQSFAVEWRDNAGTDEVRCSVVTDSAWIALTDNSWNLIHVHLDTTAASCSIAVNGGSAQTFTGHGTNGTRFLYFGACGAGATAAGQFVMDLIAVNTP